MHTCPPPQVCSDVVGVGISIAYFVPALIIGFFVIMNLFIAILLEAFADDEEEEEEADEEAEPEDNSAVLAKLAGVAQEEESKELPPLEGVSLGWLGETNGFRLGCQYIATHPTFDAFIIALIVISSVCLAMDVPRLDATSELKAQVSSRLQHPAPSHPQHPLTPSTLSRTPHRRLTLLTFRICAFSASVHIRCLLAAAASHYS